jgi:hypothetical protein
MLTLSSNSFSASYENSTKYLPAGIFVVLLAVTAAIHRFVVGSLVALLLVATYAWSPRSYTISAKTAVFSPDDVDGFLAAIRASAPVPQEWSGRQ